MDLQACETHTLSLPNELSSHHQRTGCWRALYHDSSEPVKSMFLINTIKMQYKFTFDQQIYWWQYFFLLFRFTYFLSQWGWVSYDFFSTHIYLVQAPSLTANLCPAEYTSISSSVFPLLSFQNLHIFHHFCYTVFLHAQTSKVLTVWVSLPTTGHASVPATPSPISHQPYIAALHNHMLSESPTVSCLRTMFQDHDNTILK